MKLKKEKRGESYIVLYVELSQLRMNNNLKVPEKCYTTQCNGKLSHDLRLLFAVDKRAVVFFLHHT